MYQPIVERLSQLLRNDWDHRSTMVNPLLPLALASGVYPNHAIVVGLWNQMVSGTVSVVRPDVCA